jgi:tetratricopeptide (TPR) repeat protein
VSRGGRGARKRERAPLKLLLVLLVFFAATRAETQQPTLSNLAPGGPANSPAPLAAANRLMSEGRFKDAEDGLRSYLITDSVSGKARYLLAYSLLRQGRAKESLEEYTRAASLQTPAAEDLKNVAQAYVLLDDFNDADKWLDRALAMDRRDPEIWYSVGRLRYSEQKYAEAEKCFRQTLVLAPSSVKAENNLGLALEGLNRPDEAVAAYRQAIAWQDADAPERLSEQPLLNLAILLLHVGQSSEAQTLLIRAAAIARGDSRIQEQLGQVCLQEKNFTEARKRLETAVRLDPGRSNLHFLLGQAYRHLGMQREAQTEFEAAGRLMKPPASH